MDAPPLPKRGSDRVHVYSCKVCGGKGHNARTCGITPEERRARQHEQRRGKQP